MTATPKQTAEQHEENAVGRHVYYAGRAVTGRSLTSNEEAAMSGDRHRELVESGLTYAEAEAALGAEVCTPDEFGPCSCGGCVL